LNLFILTFLTYKATFESGLGLEHDLEDLWVRI
jgi:hypothetical protein